MQVYINQYSLGNLSLSYLFVFDMFIGWALVDGESTQFEYHFGCKNIDTVHLHVWKIASILLYFTFTMMLSREEDG